MWMLRNKNMPTKNLIKAVKYLDKRFSDARNALIDFSKIYCEGGGRYG